MGSIFRISSPDEAAGLVEATKRTIKSVNKAEEDEAFREFMEKYEDVLSNALKVRLKAHIEVGEYDYLPYNEGHGREVLRRS